jgi:hypothetical protein
MFSTLDIQHSCFFSWYEAAIQESPAPVQLALLVQHPQEGEPDLLPDPLVLPFLETTMAGGRGLHTSWGGPVIWHQRAAPRECR